MKDIDPRHTPSRSSEAQEDPVPLKDDPIPDCLYDQDACSMATCTTRIHVGLRRFVASAGDYRKVLRLCPAHAPSRPAPHLRELSGAEYRDLWRDRLQFERHHGGAQVDGYMTVDEDHPGHRFLVEHWLGECRSRVEVGGRARYARSPVVLYRRRSTASYVAGGEGLVCWMTYASELLVRGSVQARKEVGVVENDLMADLVASCPGSEFRTSDRWDRSMWSPDADALARAAIRYEESLRNEDVRNVILVSSL